MDAEHTDDARRSDARRSDARRSDDNHRSDDTPGPDNTPGPDDTDRLGFLVPGDMRVQGWVWPRQAAACAAGAEALAEADAAHAAANPAGV